MGVNYNTYQRSNKYQNQTLTLDRFKLLHTLQIFVSIATDRPQMEFNVVLLNKYGSLIKVTEFKVVICARSVWVTGMHCIPQAGDLPCKQGRKCKTLLQLCWVWAASVEVEFKVKGSRTKRIETLEASMEVMMMVTLLALWIHGVLSVVKLGSHLWNITCNNIIIYSNEWDKSMQEFYPFSFGYLLAITDYTFLFRTQSSMYSGRETILHTQFAIWDLLKGWHAISTRLVVTGGFRFPGNPRNNSIGWLTHI